MKMKVATRTEVHDEEDVGLALESRVASLHKRGRICLAHCVNLKGEASTGFPVQYAFLRDGFHREPFTRRGVLDLDNIRETSSTETFDDDQGFDIDVCVILGRRLLCLHIRRDTDQ